MAEEFPGARLGIKIAILMLLLDGNRPTFVARLFSIGRMSLTRWVHRLNRQGVAGVVEKSRPSRPTQLTSGLRPELLADLQCSPEQHGLPRAAWDGATLAVLLRRRYGVSLKIRQAQNLLHRLGYRLTRAGYPYLQAKAEDAEKFRRRLKKLRHLGPRDVLVFEDKTGFSKHPRLSRLWTPCGQRARIPTRNEHRQRLNVFGWVAPLLGRHGMMHLAKRNTRAFLALLRRLRHSLRGKTIHLYVDRAP